MVYNVCSLPSTNSPKLNLCSSLSIAKLSNGSGVASMFSLLKSTYVFKQKFSSGLEWTDLTFKLTHITFNHGASQPSLGSWAIERQNDQVKHYVSSSLFYHCSGVFINFQNKTQRFYCMTLSSFSIYVVFVAPHQGNKDVMPFLFLPLRLM